MKIAKTEFDVLRKQAFRIAGGSVLLAAGIKLIFEAGCQTGVTTTQKLIRSIDPDSYEVISRKIMDFVNSRN